MLIEFYPEFGGNLEKPEEERVSVIIEPMTVADNQAMKGRIKYTRVKGFRDQLKDNSAEVIDGIFTARTKEIKNLTDPILKTPVTTAQEFIRSYCSPDLKMDIIDKIQDISTLSEDQVKNSAPPSDG